MTDVTAEWVYESIERADRLHAIENDELADRLLLLQSRLPSFGADADLVEEVIERLRVWDEPAATIRERWDAKVAEEERRLREDPGFHAAIDARVAAILPASAR